MGPKSGVLAVVNRALWLVREARTRHQDAPRPPLRDKNGSTDTRHVCDGELVGFADEDWRWTLPSAGWILRRLCFLAVSLSDNLSCLHSFPQRDFLKTFFFLQKYKSVMWTSYVQFFFKFFFFFSDHPAAFLFLNSPAFLCCSHFFFLKSS